MKSSHSNDGRLIQDFVLHRLGHRVTREECTPPEYKHHGYQVTNHTTDSLMNVCVCFEGPVPDKRWRLHLEAHQRRSL